MNFDERFQRAAEPIKNEVTRFLADLIERPSLSRDENATMQRIGEEMQSGAVVSRGGGPEALITSPEAPEASLAGRAGTRIGPDPRPDGGA